MKICKRLLPMLLVLALLPTMALAAGSVELTQRGTLTVCTRQGETPIPEMPLDVYQISTMDETGELTVLAAYEAFAQDLDIRGKNDSAWRAMAQELQDFILREAIQPDYDLCSDENGRAVLENLPLGLYLILGSAREGEGVLYRADPFFVLIPDQVDNAWVYQVEALGKVESQPLKTDLAVEKVWQDTCHADQRPKSITVHLLRDGQVVDTVTLPQDGRWRYTWEELDANHIWTVEEEVPEGYGQPEITREGNTFTIVNTCDKPESPDTPDLPQTGQLWWPVPVLLLAGVLCLAIGLARRRES